MICLAYINAKDVLPAELVIELQKYCKGDLIYIPLAEDEYHEWGSNTSTRTLLNERNEAIREKKAAGCSIAELMEEYHLSYDTIKRVLYRHKAG